MDFEHYLFLVTVTFTFFGFFCWICRKSIAEGEELNELVRGMVIASLVSTGIVYFTLRIFDAWPPF